MEDDPETQRLNEIELEITKARLARRVPNFRVSLNDPADALSRMVLDSLVRQDRLVRWVREGANGKIACYAEPQIPRE